MSAGRSAGGRTLVPPARWRIDPARSQLSFDVRHLKALHVRGRFERFDGTLTCTDGGATRIEGAVAVASIHTRDARRDARLLCEDFFDAERYPAMTYAGVAPAAAAGEPFAVRGALTICGTRRPLVVTARPATPAGGDEVRVRATTSLSRRDFGLDWEPRLVGAGLVIDDIVRIALDVVAVRC